MLRLSTINEGVSGVWIQHQPHQLLMVGFILPSSHPPPPPRRLSSLPTTELTPTLCPSPLLRDVGPSPSRSMKVTVKMRNRRGDPWNGRPSRCVTRTSHNFCCGSFFPFLIPRHRWPGELRRRQANPRDGGPIHETPGQSTRHWANPRDVGPINDTTSQFMTWRANLRHTGPIHNTPGHSG